MVTKEINEIFEHTSLAKTAAYEAGLHSNSGNEALCETKLADLRARMKEIQRMMTQLEHRIEYIKHQP